MSKRAEKSAGASTPKSENKAHKATKKPDKSPKAVAQKSGNKTPQVMRLVERDKGANLVLMAGKSRVPESLRGKEPLSGFAAGEFEDAEDTVVVNITELAINYEAPLILDRFNACSCDKCVEVFSMRIAERVPARFARVSRSAQYCSLSERNELSERVEPMRRMVLAEMTRELIGNKRRCFHNDTK